MIFRKFKRKNKFAEIAPDEIFLDSSNLPNFDKDQFEGQIEKPISKKTIIGTGFIFVLIALIFLYKIFSLEVLSGNEFREKSENNRLHHSLVFAERGAITDRNGKLLVWNTVPLKVASTTANSLFGSTSTKATSTKTSITKVTAEIETESYAYSSRVYTDLSGIYNLLGYVKYPKKDKYGFYYDTNYVGGDGVEKYFDSILAGQNGLKINETDAFGKILSESVTRPSKKGENLALSIDADVQSYLYKYIQDTAIQSGFQGGAGIIMNVHTGEVLASVSYPEYDSNVMTRGKDVEKIKAYLNNKNNPFLDRVSSGLYAPGSILKPFFAFAALAEGIISPEKQIESTGSMKVPNPYKPGEFSVFKDWRVNGWTDMRRAIAVSSDIYFYEIGGGVPGQKGLGIENIGKYARLFGFEDPISNNFFSGKKGVIPNPEWKAKNFKGDIWRLGDTYNTAIGQYGFQVTLSQVVRAVASLVNGGNLISPTIISERSLKHLKDRGQVLVSQSRSVVSHINNANEKFEVVKEGMRMSVTEGTMTGLNVPYVKIAGKTGTAQVGVANQYINSWAVGFFPYEKPEYAFAVLLERGPSNAVFGATAAMRNWFDWMSVNKPQYLE